MKMHTKAIWHNNYIIVPSEESIERLRAKPGKWWIVRLSGNVLIFDGKTIPEIKAGIFDYEPRPMPGDRWHGEINAVEIINEAEVFVKEGRIPHNATVGKITDEEGTRIAWWCER